MNTGTLPVRTFAALLGCLLAFAPPAARAGDEDKKAAAAAEKSFLQAYAEAGPDEKLRAKAVSALSSAPDAVKVAVVLDRILPRDDSPQVQAAAVSVLRGVKGEEELKALGAVVKGNGAWEVRGPVFEALGSSEAPVVHAALRSVLRTTETKALAAALFALAEKHPKEFLEDARKLLVHDAWQVRLGALDYFGRLRDPSTLALLVDRLEDETGRLRQEVVEALKAVSGQDYGTDAAQWRAFAAGGEKAAKEAGKKPADPAAGGGGRAVATGDPPVEPTYYGQKVYSDRVVFIVDVSLSMNEEMVVDRDMIVRETGAVVSSGDNPGGPGEKAGPDPKKDGEIIPIEWWKIRTRMDFARSQLKYVVSTLKRDQWFDIVWFSDSVKAWKGQMVPAQPGTKVKAAEWLDSLKCEAGTNTWGGLMKGLNLVGRGGAEENYTRGADTLYFLSDGEPSIGDIKDKDQIVAAIERIHKVRRVKVNVVQIGTSPMPFMKRLASATGGDYKFFNSKGPQK